MIRINSKHAETGTVADSVSPISPANDDKKTAAFLSGTHPHPSGTSGLSDLRSIISVLKRKKGVIFGITMLAAMLAAIFLYMQTPRYTAESLLQFNMRKQQVVDIKSVMMGLSGDESAINSELDIMKSSYLVGRVYDRLDLSRNQEFRKEFIDKADSFALIGWITGFLATENEQVAESQAAPEAIREKERNAGINGIVKRLAVIRVPRSYTVKVQFTSESPDLAALIANTLADEYLVNELELKFAATKRANNWLKERVMEMQKKVHESENAVQLFKEKHDLIKLSGETVGDKQLSELNSQLILARTELAQAEARLAQSKELAASKNGVESALEVMSSPLIQKLREQEAGILREKSELESRYGKRHPLIIKIRAQLKDLRKKIDSEIQKIIQGLEYEVEIARTKVTTLASNLDDLQRSKDVTNRAEVQLSELVRQMETDLALYESFLSRFKETSHQTLEQNDATIINQAAVPSKPSWPRKKIILVIAAILGLALGIALSFLIEMLDNGFRSSEQIEDMLHAPAIGMVPELSGKADIADYVTKNPTSAFAESLRSVMTAVHFSNPDNPPKSIMVTSSVPGEGKSTISVSLARVTAMSGSKVLLVDCDMRRPTVDKAFDRIASKGIGELLAGTADVKEVIMKDDKTGLHYIRAFPNTPHSRELLSSRKMHDFMKKVTNVYDMVILDSPPVMALSDALMLSEMVDTAILLVQWEKTARSLTANALKQLVSTGVPISGVVLSRVDIPKHEKYGYSDSGSYYGKYKDYYTSD